MILFKLYTLVCRLSLAALVTSAAFRNVIAKAGTTGARRQTHDANAHGMTYTTGLSTFCVIDGKCWPTRV
jgi:hypothetical protein